MKTEEEARKCWCPFARFIGNAQADSRKQFVTGNRIAIHVANETEIDANPSPARCIASECMAWRAQTLTKTQTLERGEQPEPDAKAKGWKTPTTTVMGRVVWELKRVGGYCGLAGKP